MTRKENYVTKRNKIIKRMHRAFKEMIFGKYGYYSEDNEECEEMIKEILVIIFYKILKINILNWGTIYFIYLQIMKLDWKDKINALLKIYLHLRLQIMNHYGIITKKELNSIFPEKEKFWLCFEDGAYNVYFDYDFIGKDYDENEILDEDFFYALCEFAYYTNFDEWNIYYWYEEFIKADVENLSEQIKNLIVRFRIEQLRRDGILTRYDEALFMRKLPENDLTYQFYDYDTVLKWKWYPYKDMFEYIRAKKGGN